MIQAVIPFMDMEKIDLSNAPWFMHEFFAGSGLVAYGLKDIFAPVWANDICTRKAAVYEANFNSKHFYLGDVKDVRGEELPFAHMSWASFPCQDLSLAGTINGIEAKRSGLVWEWLRILDEIVLKPRILVVENVSGLLSSANGENYKKLHMALIERGYDCGAILVDATHFVPQSRPRVFVIAVDREYHLPEEVLGEGPCWLHNRRAAALGETLPHWIWWSTKEPPARVSRVEDYIETDVSFDKDEVLRLIPEKHREILNGNEIIYATGFRRTREGRQQLELRFDGIAGCLRTPEGGSSKQFLIIKKDGKTEARLLTVREAARLMGVPDSFILPGTQNDGYRAMGDAVALPVARFIGENFLKIIAGAIYDEND